MKKIYIAAAYARKDEMLGIRKLLESKGHIVTAQWVTGAEEKMGMAAAAQMDLDDLSAADVCLSFTYPKGTAFVGGGRHTELGYALAIGKRCIIVGEREQVFHHLPAVEQYTTLEEALGVL